MHQITKNAITKLQKETNRVLLVADFELIEELDQIAGELGSVTKQERRLIGSPFSACGMRFYPWTVAKSIWYREKLEEFEIQPIYEDAFLFWLLTITNEGDALDKFSDRKSVNKAMRKASRNLKCSPEEMSEIFMRCTGVIKKTSNEAEEGETEPAANYGGLIAVLLKEYGGTPDQWLWETPTDTIAALFDQYAKRCEAEQNAARESASKGGKAVAPRNDMRIATLARINKKVNAIREIWSKEDG